MSIPYAKKILLSLTVLSFCQVGFASNDRCRVQDKAVNNLWIKKAIAPACELPNPFQACEGVLGQGRIEEELLTTVKTWNNGDYNHQSTSMVFLTKLQNSVHGNAEARSNKVLNVLTCLNNTSCTDETNSILSDLRMNLPKIIPQMRKSLALASLRIHFAHLLGSRELQAQEYHKLSFQDFIDILKRNKRPLRKKINHLLASTSLTGRVTSTFYEIAYSENPGVSQLAPLTDDEYNSAVTEYYQTLDSAVALYEMENPTVPTEALSQKQAELTDQQISRQNRKQKTLKRIRNQKFVKFLKTRFQKAVSNYYQRKYQKIIAKYPIAVHYSQPHSQKTFEANLKDALEGVVGNASSFANSTGLERMDVDSSNDTYESFRKNMKYLDEVENVLASDSDDKARMCVVARRMFSDYHYKKMLKEKLVALGPGLVKMACKAMLAGEPATMALCFAGNAVTTVAIAGFARVTQFKEERYAFSRIYDLTAAQGSIADFAERTKKAKISGVLTVFSALSDLYNVNGLLTGTKTLESLVTSTRFENIGTVAKTAYGLYDKKIEKLAAKIGIDLSFGGKKVDDGPLNVLGEDEFEMQQTFSEIVDIILDKKSS